MRAKLTLIRLPLPPLVGSPTPPYCLWRTKQFLFEVRIVSGNWTPQLWEWFVKLYEDDEHPEKRAYQALMQEDGRASRDRIILCLKRVLGILATIAGCVAVLLATLLVVGSTYHAANDDSKVASGLDVRVVFYSSSAVVGVVGIAARQALVKLEFGGGLEWFYESPVVMATFLMVVCQTNSSQVVVFAACFAILTIVLRPTMLFTLRLCKPIITDGPLNLSALRTWDLVKFLCGYYHRRQNINVDPPSSESTNATGRILAVLFFIVLLIVASWGLPGIVAASNPGSEQSACNCSCTAP